MSPRRLLAVVALLSLLSACSGDDDTASAPTTAASTTTAPATTVPPTTVPATTAPPTTTAAPTTVATTVPPTTVPEPMFDDWCSAARAVDEVTAGRDDVDFTDPEQVEDYLEPLVVVLREAVPLAPPELAGDVVLSAGNTVSIYEALRENGFDMLTLDLSELGLDLDAGEAAADAIESYNEAECGIPIDDEGDGGDDVDLGDGSLRDLFVGRLVDGGFAEDEAGCLFDELDFGDLDAITDDAVEGAFAACEIDLERIDELSSVLGG